MNKRFFSSVSRSTFSLVVLIALALASASGAHSVRAAAPKAYVGLFKDNAVAVIDTGANKVLSIIPIPTGPHGMVISPDGKTVYVSSDGDSKVSLIDTATDQVTSSIDVGKTPHGLALTPDGKLLLVGGFGTDKVLFVDTVSKQITESVTVGKPHNIAISPDGKTAYVASQTTGAFQLAILNLADKTQSGTVALDKTPRALNFNHDGTLLYFTQLDVDALQVLDVATNKVTTQIVVGASPHHPLLNEEYGFVVSQKTNELGIFDPAKNKITNTIKVGTNPHWIAVMGDTVYVTNEGSDDVTVVDVETQKVMATIPVGKGPRKIVVQPAPEQAVTTPVATPNQ